MRSTVIQRKQEFNLVEDDGHEMGRARRDRKIMAQNDILDHHLFSLTKWILFSLDLDRLQHWLLSNFRRFHLVWDADNSAICHGPFSSIFSSHPKDWNLLSPSLFHLTFIDPSLFHTRSHIISRLLPLKCWALRLKVFLEPIPPMAAAIAKSTALTSAQVRRTIPAKLTSSPATLSISVRGKAGLPRFSGLKIQSKRSLGLAPLDSRRGSWVSRRADENRGIACEAQETAIDGEFMFSPFSSSNANLGIWKHGGTTICSLWISQSLLWSFEACALVETNYESEIEELIVCIAPKFWCIH